MLLTNEQKNVLVAMVDWLRGGKKQFLTVGGFAGTGKTTLTAQFRSVLHKLLPSTQVAFCAYTGKASRVLQNALQQSGAVFEGDSVSTIHSLIYAPITSGISVTGWRLKEAVYTDVIVVDEASMVDKKIWTDLLSFGKPVLAVGDHGQLPPIDGQFNLMNNPELRLETIHRQAEDNPIIHLSLLARKEGVIPVGRFGPGVRKLDRYDSSSASEVEECLRGYSSELLILAGYNQSRLKLNQTVRAFMDMDGEKPKVGDCVICLRNNWEKGIYNGMTGNLSRLIPVQNGGGDVDWYEAEIGLDDGEVYAGKISAHQFGEPSTLSSYHNLKGKALGDLWDFGYALTVHKAQGSQSPKVLLFEERNKHMSDDDWRRWLYTGVTRAEKELTIVGT